MLSEWWLVEAAYNLGDEWLEELLAYLQGNIDFAVDFINKYLPNVHVIKPEATYLLWLDFRGSETGAGGAD